VSLDVAVLAPVSLSNDIWPETRPTFWGLLVYCSGTPGKVAIQVLLRVLAEKMGFFVISPVGRFSIVILNITCPIIKV